MVDHATKDRRKNPASTAPVDSTAAIQGRGTDASESDRPREAVSCSCRLLLSIARTCCDS